ncbi:PREDICTED: uncharacterized protein LOC106103910 [Papilio polytes]|uniref:uncharacterized protein LOC106103910 n=1 Tax=Papilio polytes TaxID=76194 RepID=UPI0006764C74|nr:PREDICTED: uncharacterized protein LOC106103910 [Papilio polytes]
MHLHILILIFFLRTTKGDGILPVFMLDFDRVLTHVKVEPNPLVKISTEFFLDLLQDSKKSSKVVVIFIEELLCNEDISSKDIKGTPYRNMHDELLSERVKYFPAVYNPYKALKQIFANHNKNVFHVGDMDKLKMYEARNGHYYIYFEDNFNETRIDTLRRHDLIVKEIYNAVRNFATGPVIGFYTGKSNPIILKKYKVLPKKRKLISMDGGVSVESRDALFRFVGVYSSSAKRQSRFSHPPVVADERLSRRHLSTKVAYTDFELEFNFSFKKDGWVIDDVALLEGGEEVGRTRMGAGAPWENSYVCGEPLVIINLRDGSAVTISHYQIQAFRRHDRSYDDMIYPEWDYLRASTNNTCKGFGPGVNCGPYFTSTIIACMFVTSVCFGILLVGVIALMNCVTNDRYDDAQGKQLSVSAEAGG